ncbi:MAG: hypothetical protein SVZ03_02520 [Spirochaetota bacterium]|nr:hypothetical protein [Spirochaetota bacterium]
MKKYSGFHIIHSLIFALLLIIGCASDTIDDSPVMDNTGPIIESVDDSEEDADSTDDTNPNVGTDTDDIQDIAEQISMIFVGDIMLDRKVKTMVERGRW